jgi:tetratricopeptide (TPR) repeat protein
MQRFPAAAILVLAVSARAVAAQCHQISDLPKLTVTDFLPEVRDQVQQAYDRVRAHPQDGGATGRLGMLLDLYSRTDDASACYQRAHQLDPDSFKWLYYLGSLQARLGNHNDAVRTLRMALRLRPDYLPARLKLAESLLDSGDLTDSGALYSTIVHKYPEAAEAYFGLGRISVSRGQTADASRDFHQACELFPTYGAAHYELAQVERKLGNTEESQREISLYLQHRTLVPPVDDPLRDELRQLDRAAPSLLERGVELQDAGRTQDAVAATERALQLDPKLVRAHINLITLYGGMGDLQKAEEHYQAAVKLDPDHFPDAYYDHGVLLIKERKLADAEAAFRKALEINPRYADAHNNLGYLLEREGKIAEASDQYRAAIEDEPDFRRAHFNLGRILINEGKYQAGIEQFKQTLTSTDQDTPSYLYALGAAYGRSGDQQNALRYLQQARAQAAAQSQSQLLSEIDKDLHTLDAGQNSH